MRSIKRILIANRGEIAIRIMKTLKLLDIEAVGVYSEADKLSKHISYADKAYNIGEPEALKSYLNTEKIIDIAKQAKCDAIHPGYGFLAENPTFAAMVQENALIWIGPPPNCMRNLGDKINSRIIAQSVGIPTTPGGTIESIEQAHALANELGYPILIKASAGGGGKGMRIVNSDKELEEAIIVAKKEAQAAFADPTVYIEKYIEDAHHIEIQFIIDKFGNGLYFPERECSIQRRYQKIVEESPSPTINREVAKKMGEAAISVTKKAGYYNAGTVEFIYDKKNEKFYFLEVNARIQVEHPVTEEISGFDFIASQIDIAEEKQIKLSQDELNSRINGHAIESRIYAEDTENNFMSSVGKIEHYKEPSGFGIRVDSGFFEGSNVLIYYDSLISKLIVKAPNRNMAIKKMYKAVSDYHISPIKTTIPLLKNIFSHKKFIEGEYNTRFLETYRDDLFSKKQNSSRIMEAIVLFEYLKQYKHPNYDAIQESSMTSCWESIGNWRG
ncbi:Biotin carboxylase of acetyl-CoA carboxylase [Desulfurella amilsii]|uniref:Biotin carboxylase of acetyl-CoA carboxylase n=1 Tax=Desulfurella amilsii TaxID=1562698 RepID=A0A1X4XUM8_9BACT|nr:biotin carboxylase N-terminal domain-containing protein [Desulfurella amilsii]OSS41247.1 Biotin carboxylase of acetyl-CoA carboxylase [Desulfurella amilsii]